MTDQPLLRRALGWACSDRGRLILSIFLAASLLTPPNLYWHPITFAFLALLPSAFLLRSRPIVAASLVAVLGGLLRLGFLDIHTGDQISIAQMAGERVLAGLSPYGVWYPSFTPNFAPYPYGPWAWLVAEPGVAVELLATAGILGFLIWRRAWLTSALFACWGPVIVINASGTNEYSMTFFVIASLAIAESHPRLSALSLAFATGLKLQALAWAPGLFSFLPRPARWLLVGSTLLLWIPVLFWGPEGFIQSLLMADSIKQWDNGLGLNMPWLQILVPVAAIMGMRSRSIAGAALSGAAIFYLMLMTPDWSSVPYWFPVLAAAGLAVEMALQNSPRVSVVTSK